MYATFMLLVQVEVRPVLTDARLRQLIGERLKAKRGKRLTQRQLAEAIGVDKTLISKWEHGHASPTTLQLLHLGTALGERPETFIEGLVEPHWEQLAHGLAPQAKAIVYDLVKLLREEPSPPVMPARTA